MFGRNGIWLLFFGIGVLALVSFTGAYAEYKELSKPKRFLLGLMWFQAMMMMTLIFAYVYSLD